MRDILSSSSSSSSSMQHKKKDSGSYDSSQDDIEENDLHKQNLSQSSSQSNSLDQEIEYLSSKAMEKLKNPTKRIQKKSKQDTQIKGTSNQLSLVRKSQMSQKAEERRALCLFNSYLPNQVKEFFLINDVYIELDKSLTNEMGFEKYRALQNELRPISRIKHIKESGFLILEFDEAKRGLSDFTQVIEQLKSLQDQDYYYLAETLSIYNSLMSMSRQLDLSIPAYERQARYTRNKVQMQQYIDNTIPEILKPLDKSKFYIYFLYDMTEGFHNQTRKQYGMNEKYIQMFGSNVEELTNMQLRQGWFNLTQYNDRNRQSMEYFLNIKAVYENSFDFNSVNIKLEYDMVTIENIIVPVHVIPQYHFCFSKIDSNPIQQDKPLMIGIFYLMEIVLQPHSKKMIRDIRSIKNSTQNSNNPTNGSPNVKTDLPFSYQKYQQIANQVYTNDASEKTVQSYSQQSQKFISTFLDNSTGDSQNAQNLQNLHPEKICKFVQIQTKQ